MSSNAKGAAVDAARPDDPARGTRPPEDPPGTESVGTAAPGTESAGQDPTPGSGAQQTDTGRALDKRELAQVRAEAVAEAGDAALVGSVVDTYPEPHTDGIRVITVRFEAFVDGYRGWLWSVTTARLGDAPTTVSEVVLLPGPDALTAPDWVPWKERVRSEDLHAGDVLPAEADDERLVPAYLESDDPAVEEVAHEWGIGRVRVLSRLGRVHAAERWHTGDFGPDAPMATKAPGSCATCAFYLPLAGSLGARFGACGNEYSPADGHVVDADYGCGAHSEATVRRRSSAAVTDTVVDEMQLEVHAHPEAHADAEAASTADEADAPGSVPHAGHAESTEAAGAAESDRAAESGGAAESAPAAGSRDRAEAE